MADQPGSSSQDTSDKRDVGSVPSNGKAHGNPLKRVIEPSEDPQKESTGTTEQDEPVIRGDGTVLPKRSEAQPRNPMKRMMDTSRESNS